MGLRRMAVENMVERLTQQSKLFSEETWARNICRFLQGEKLDPQEQKQALASLLLPRESTIDNISRINGVELTDFLGNKVPLEMFGNKYYRPFTHPYYWGAFYCCGTGLTEIY